MTAFTIKQFWKKITGTAVAAATVAALGAVLLYSPPAAAQADALPADVAASFDTALRRSELAADNAAFSANIANNGRPTAIADRTRQSITQSNIAEAVVEGIARYPSATAAIVRAAVARAPDHAQAIVHRASYAFPSFGAVIAQAAGLPQTAAAAPTFASLSALPSYGQPIYGQPSYSQAPLPSPTMRTAQAATTAVTPMRNSPARGSSWWPGFGLSEVRFGVVHHDTGVFGRNKEGSVDIALGVRFKPLGGEFWSTLQNPRPFINANINTKGESSALDAGLNWDWDAWGKTFFSFSLGGALHDGKLSTTRLDRKELGSRVLFYLAAEYGYRFNARNSLAVRLDHMSNANLADNNEGLDTVGLIYGYHF